MSSPLGPGTRQGRKPKPDDSSRCANGRGTRPGPLFSIIVLQSGLAGHVKAAPSAVQLGGRETIWASSRIRNRPGQTLEVQTICAPPEYCREVIRPGDPHSGQASTATKLGAKDSRNWAKSSRNTMSLGAISARDDRFDICRSVGSGSKRSELGVLLTASRPGTAPGFPCLLPCFATALSPLLTAKIRIHKKCVLTARFSADPSRRSNAS